jgi:hypothetical protein
MKSRRHVTLKTLFRAGTTDMAYGPRFNTRCKPVSSERLMNGDRLTAALILLLASGLSACGGSQTQPSTPSPPPPPPPPQISISILPASANLAAGGSQQFTASVTGGSNTAIIWEVNGVAGGNAVTGTISTTGLYTAPNSASNNVISAVAQANQSDSAKASVSVLAPHRLVSEPPQLWLSSTTAAAEMCSSPAATTTSGWPR